MSHVRWQNLKKSWNEIIFHSLMYKSWLKHTWKYHIFNVVCSSIDAQHGHKRKDVNLLPSIKKNASLINEEKRCYKDCQVLSRILLPIKENTSWIIEGKTIVKYHFISSPITKIQTLNRWCTYMMYLAKRAQRAFMKLNGKLEKRNDGSFSSGGYQFVDILPSIKENSAWSGPSVDKEASTSSVSPVDG